MSLLFPEPKRRKLVSAGTAEAVVITGTGTEVRLDGTITPLQTIETTNDRMDTEVSPRECPCGYLHGPGFDHYHDISAVGFSVDVMRGPE